MHCIDRGATPQKHKGKDGARCAADAEPGGSAGSGAGWYSGAVMRAMIVGVALALTGCGAGMLRAPVESGCNETGLEGCPQITEGVLLVVDGDKAAGLEKLKAGAGANQPAELVLFAKALKAIGALPGLQPHMAPIVEVCTVIEQLAEAREKELAAAKAESPTGAAAQGTAPAIADAAHEGRRGEGRRAVTADTDASRMITTMFVVTKENREVCDPRDPFGALMCGRAAVGPLVITDLDVPKGCTVYAASLPTGEQGPVWQLQIDGSRGGVRWLIGHGHRFVMRTESAIPDAACPLVWSGFRPYE